MAERIEVAERGLEDFFMLECTPRYPILKLREMLQRTHKVVLVRDGPELHGLPQRRMRTLAIALSYKTMAWHGLSTDAGIAADYAS